MPPPSPIRTASGASSGDEAFEVALAGGGEEARGQGAALAGVGVEARAVVLDPAARADEDLAAVGLGTVDDRRDRREVDVERLPEHEHRALDRRQALEQHEHRQRHGLLGLHGGRRLRLDQGLGKPRALVGLAAHARGAQDVDRQPRGDRRQPRALVLDVTRGLPPQVRLLHDVLGLGDRAEHSVGDREEQISHGGCHRLARRLVQAPCTFSSQARPALPAARSSPT